MAQNIEKENGQMLDELFQAIDVITTKRLEHLKFDKTLTCQIINADNCEKGEYIVSDGSVEFVAYSENPKYRVNNWVYVTIPNGDFNQPKLITGKYVANNTEYSTYINPLDTYIDITGNLITGSIDPEVPVGLIANNPNKLEIELWKVGEMSIAPQFSIDELDNEVSEITQELSKFDRLGLRASFKSLLGNYNLIMGHYGLRLDIVSMDPGSTSTQKTHNFTTMSLDTDDMFGNPYNFVTWSQQQYVFDISNLDNIVGMRLVFYQDNNFVNTENSRIPNYSSEEEWQVYLAMANILVKDIYISLGYDLNNFEEDQTFLYCFEPLTFASYLTDTARNNLINNREGYTEDFLNTVEGTQQGLELVNEKNLHLRWVHTDEENGYVQAIDNIEDIETYGDSISTQQPAAKIHWYQWRLEDGVEDELAGAFWEENTDLQNSFNWEHFHPNPLKPFEKIKTIIEYPSFDYMNYYYNNTIDDYLLQIIDELNQDGITEEDVEFEEALTEAANNYLIECLSQCVLYESKILEFTNEHEVPDTSTVELLRGLQLLCDEDNYKGIYRIYNPSGYIMNNGESTKRRIISAQFDTLITGDKKLDKAEIIRWYFPVNNTMIELPVEGCEYDLTDEYTMFAGLDPNSNESWFMIERRGVAVDEGEERQPGEIVPTVLEQIFRIKSYYTQAANNNIIKCEVYKNNRTYYAEYQLFFGVAGSNGTDYTLTVTYEEEKEPGQWVPMTLPVFDWTASGPYKTIRLVPHLFDYENNEITDEYRDSFSYAFYSRPVRGHGLQVNTEYDDEANKTGNFIITINSDLENPTFSNFYHYIIEIIANKAVTIKSSHLNETIDDILEENEDMTIEEATDIANEMVTSDLVVNLTTYCPIGIRFNSEYVHMDGDNRVVYSFSGTNPIYYKNPYALYKFINNKLEKQDNIKWYIDLGNDNNKSVVQYYPQIDQNTGSLVVPSLFMSTNEHTVSILACIGNRLEDDSNVVWCQPLYIFQETYASSMLNAWDGSLVINEEDNTIMSAMVGAGYKDDENHFNGVLMGNVGNKTGVTGTNKETGLFGYHEGVQSFGFKIDGTAFLGKAGHGQILFDGNEGQIVSASFNTRYYDPQADERLLYGGMRIDLDNAFMDLWGDETIDENNQKRQTKIHLGVSGTNADPYFKIQDNLNNTTLFLAANNNYYLQTSDFQTASSSRVGSGVKFDLKNGKLIGYNFTLEALTSYGTGTIGVTIDSSGNPFLSVKAAATYANANNAIIEVLRISQRDVSFDISDGDTNQDNGEPAVKTITSKFVLQSTDYKANKSGTMIDIQNGKITSFNFSIIAKYGISTDSSTYTDAYMNKYIKINSGASKYPLIVGTGSGQTKGSEDFAVAWDGSIYATIGQIGGFTILKEGLFTGGIPGATFSGVGIYSMGTADFVFSVGTVQMNPTYHLYYTGTQNVHPDDDDNESSTGYWTTTTDISAYNRHSGAKYITYQPNDTNTTNFLVRRNGDLEVTRITATRISVTDLYNSSAVIGSATITNCTITNKLVYKGATYSAKSKKVVTSVSGGGGTLTPHAHTEYFVNSGHVKIGDTEYQLSLSSGRAFTYYTYTFTSNSASAGGHATLKYLGR